MRAYASVQAYLVIQATGTVGQERALVHLEGPETLLRLPSDVLVQAHSTLAYVAGRVCSRVPHDQSCTLRGSVRNAHK